MPKGKPIERKELVIPKSKNVADEVKKMSISPEQKRQLTQVIRGMRKDRFFVSVRMKMTGDERDAFYKYVRMANEEGKVSKEEYKAQSEVAAYALRKLLRGDSYFQKKLKDKYVPKEFTPIPKKEKKITPKPEVKPEGEHKGIFGGFKK